VVYRDFGEILIKAPVNLDLTLFGIFLYQASRIIRSIDEFTSVIFDGAPFNHLFAACTFASIDMSGWFSS
jgi:hypothetical protein